MHCITVLLGHLVHNLAELARSSVHIHRVLLGK